MRVWIYTRLSHDDDRETNSLRNQREICRAFAEQHGWPVVGESADDNASGMSFSRCGLDQITEAVEHGSGVLVGVDRDRIREAALKLLEDAEAIPAIERRCAAQPFGDGTASLKIAETLKESLLN